MSGRSLFSKIARYTPTDRRDPREDILTQAFAATLEVGRGAGLVDAVLGIWLGDSVKAGDAVTIVPQFKAPSGDRIDLSIALAGESGEKPSGLVWVEVKHQARLSGVTQLQKYYDQLFSDAYRADYKVLVFLPPAGYAFDPEEEPHVPADIVASSWQAVGLTLRAWRQQAGHADERADWIVGEFLEFLDEEGLFVTGGLDEEQLASLRGFERAAKSFGALAEEAERQIDAWVRTDPRLGPEDEWRHWPRRGALGWDGYWKTYPAGESVRLEWNFDRPGHAQAFGAGVTFLEQPNDGYWQALVGRLDGTEFEPDLEYPPRIFRYWTIEEILEASDETATGQGSGLASNVIGAFKDAGEAIDSIIPGE